MVVHVRWLMEIARNSCDRISSCPKRNSSKEDGSSDLPGSYANKFLAMVLVNGKERRKKSSEDIGAAKMQR